MTAASRFHVLDLARELDSKGYSVDFYSFLPQKRAASFGLRPRSHVNVSLPLAPAAIWQMKAGNFAPAIKEAVTWRWIDWVVEKALRPCDALVFMSGIYLETARKAHREYNAKLIIERGSKHIEVQKDILDRSNTKRSITDFEVAREVEGYRMADRISVASKHVQDSFGREPNLTSKIMRNPYGVDLDMFPMAHRISTNDPKTTFIFAGQWSYRKGCDLLVEVLRRNPDYQLLHAGTIGDIAQTTDLPNIKHMGHLDQKELVSAYHNADALVLASREDGFGLVLPQALAAGLPIICTQDTGGPDLKHTDALGQRISIVRSNDLESLEHGMRSLSQRIKQRQIVPISELDRHTLSWAAYADRYDQNLKKLFNV